MKISVTKKIQIGERTIERTATSDLPDYLFRKDMQNEFQSYFYSLFEAIRQDQNQNQSQNIIKSDKEIQNSEGILFENLKKIHKQEREIFDICNIMSAKGKII